MLKRFLPLAVLCFLCLACNDADSENRPVLTEAALIAKPIYDQSPPAEWPNDGILYPDGSLNLTFGAAESRKNPGLVIEQLGGIPEELQPYLNPQGPEAVFYPFCDATEQGVGHILTRGWYPLGSILLSQQTDAKPAVVIDPSRLGVLPYARMVPPAERNAAYWAGHIRSSGEVPHDAFVVTGVYTAGGDGRVMASVFTLSPGSQEPADLLEAELGAGDDFLGLLRGQCRVATNIMDALLEQELVPKRKDQPAPSEELLKDQLGRVMIASNSMHTYAVQSAVNRALLLARAYPGRQEPLQAAAYGMLAMAEPLYSETRNLYGTMLGQGEALSIIALAEVGLITKPDSVALRFLLGKAIRFFAIPSEPLISEGFNVTDLPPCWRTWVRYSRYEYNHITPEQAQVLPMWIVLSSFTDDLWFLGQSAIHEMARGALMKRKDTDMMPVLIALNAGWLEGDKFTNLVFNANETQYEDLENYLALAVTMGGASSKYKRLREEVIRDIAAVSGEQRLGPILDAAEAGDYFAVRKELVAWREAWILDDSSGLVTGAVRWSHLENPHSSTYRLLGIARTLDDSSRYDETQMTASTGFQGIEFTPWRRFQFARDRLPLGITLFADFLKTEFGSQAMLKDLLVKAGPFIQEGPLYALCQWRAVAEYPGLMPEGYDDVKFMAELNAQLPQDVRFLRELAEAHYVQHRYTECVPIFQEASRQNRFNPYFRRDLALFFRDHGCASLTIRYYEDFVSRVPTRYDIRNDMNWLKAQMGSTEDFTAQFREPVDRLPGNNRFWIDLINYQALMLKDYDAAAETAEEAVRWMGLDAERLRVMIEIKRGDKEKAREILAETTKPNARGSLARMSYYINKARNYMELGDMDKARKYGRMGEQEEPHAYMTMRFFSEFTLKNRDWEGCEEWMTLINQRYGLTPADMAIWAKKAWGMGDREAAVTYLERLLEEDPNRMALVPPLMEFYAERGEKERAEALMQHALNAQTRHPGHLEKTLSAYVELFPERAEEIRASLPGALKGPETLEEIAGIRFSSTPILPRAAGGGS
ncbi:MAG: hypothetical protein PWP23_1050 [Candidatus Sumerlaeota bacterium]|nr:hypothetical protein [Candidatus Sumerlaeota bacterium]